MLGEVFRQLWEVLLDKHLDDVRVLVQARQAYLINISQLARFNELHKEPEGERGRAVHK